MLPDVMDVDLGLSAPKLGLVTSVFACVGRRIKCAAEGSCLRLLGGEAALAHFGCTQLKGPVEFMFNDIASRAAAELAQLLKTDISASIWKRYGSVRREFYIRELLYKAVSTCLEP